MEKTTELRQELAYYKESVITLKGRVIELEKQIEDLRQIKHYLNEDLLAAKMEIADLRRTVNAWESIRGDR